MVDDNAKLVWDMNIQFDNVIEARRLDLVLQGWIQTALHALHEVVKIVSLLLSTIVKISSVFVK